MSTSAFFTSDDAISRKLECEATCTASEDLDKIYEITNTVQWILDNNFSTVALQFSDHLLVDAPKVCRLIQDEVPNSIVFVLGDTSYGSCCVDEVAAQHYKADSIVHYGPACLSPTMRLPVFYVLGRYPLDVENCVASIIQQFSDTALKAVLAYDTKYAYLIGQVFEQLQRCLPNLLLSKMHIPSRDADTQDTAYQSMYPGAVDKTKSHDGENTSTVIRCGRIVTLPKEDNIDYYSFIYLGKSTSPTVVNMMMNFNKSPFFAYDPEKPACERIALNVNRALMKRYYLIERAKDANIIGILAGTLGVAKYRDMIDHLKALIKRAGKKSYTFVVGKLNPQKLGNFAEVEVYVLVSCSESCLFDQADFHVPVVTPYEMEVACNKAREWTGDYITDFSTLLPGSAKFIEVPENNQEEEDADVSLISNRIRVIGNRTLPEPTTQSHDLVLRSDSLTVATKAENAGDFLSMRSWQGLQQDLGKTPVAKAVEGQSGIAASYQNEPNP